MDFIEKLFGIAPDGGDGSLEVLWIAAIATTVVAVAFRRRIGAWLSQRSTSRTEAPLPVGCAEQARVEPLPSGIVLKHDPK